MADIEKVVQTPMFKKAVKKLKKNQKSDLDKAVKVLIDDPKAGEKKNGDFCFFCNRKSRPIYSKAVALSEPDAVLYPKNCFLNFGFQYIFKKFFAKNRWHSLDKKYGKISVAPYGGLLLPVKIFDKVDPPLSSYYLYQDDIDFTYRITQAGYDIVMLSECEVKDLEESWSKSKQGFWESRFPLLFENSLFRVYYAVRNQIYFQKKFRTSSKSVFYFHGILYFSFISILAFVFQRLSSLRTIREAVMDGLAGRMGENRKYVL